MTPGYLNFELAVSDPCRQASGCGSTDGWKCTRGGLPTPCRSMFTVRCSNHLTQEKALHLTCCLLPDNLEHSQGYFLSSRDGVKLRCWQSGHQGGLRGNVTGCLCSGETVRLAGSEQPHCTEKGRGHSEALEPHVVT